MIQQEPCRYESSVNNLACDSTAAHCQLLDKLVQANVEKLNVMRCHSEMSIFREDQMFEISVLTLRSCTQPHHNFSVFQNSRVIIVQETRGKNILDGFLYVLFFYQLQIQIPPFLLLFKWFLRVFGVARSDPGTEIRSLFVSCFPMFHKNETQNPRASMKVVYITS